MHRLIEAAGRRSAGLAAGVILTGGLVGGVLLAPSAAYAATTTIAINSATPSFGGVAVSVSVTNGTNPLGTFSVAGAGGSCTGNLYGGTFGMPGNGSGSGRCTIQNVGPGTYSLTASYDGATGTGSVTVPTSGPTPGPTQGGNAPVFTADSPSTSMNGQSFSYQFQATNSPSFQLVGGPSWLSISNSGMVSGNVPNGINSFSFSVKAWNNWGFATAGPFNIFFHHNFFNFAETNLHTSLSCTSPVFNGGRGSCTLWVNNSNQNFFWGPGQYNQNFGQNFASDVTAQISLPWQLRAQYCGYYFYNYGCQIYGNTAYENLGNLYPGQTKSLTVHFTVRSGFGIWGNNPGNWFYVRVVGSASSNHDNFNFFGRGQSYSTAYVQIRPYGIWW